MQINSYTQDSFRSYPRFERESFCFPEMTNDIFCNCTCRNFKSSGDKICGVGGEGSCGEDKQLNL